MVRRDYECSSLRGLDADARAISDASAGPFGNRTDHAVDQAIAQRPHVHPEQAVVEVLHREREIDVQRSQHSERRQNDDDAGDEQVFAQVVEQFVESLGNARCSDRYCSRATSSALAANTSVSVALIGSGYNSPNSAIPPTSTRPSRRRILRELSIFDSKF